jgi:two-component system, response regulator YesN
MSEATHNPAHASCADGGCGTRRRVMLVDDDIVALTAMDRLLRQWGHDVTPFGSYETARAGLTTDPPPDVLVVDVRLGMFNGLQLLHLTKQLHPGVTVIAISGFDDPVLRAEATVAGAAYLVKPVDLAELRRHLAESPEAQAAAEAAVRKPVA